MLKCLIYGPKTSRNGQNWPYLSSRFYSNALHNLRNNFCFIVRPKSKIPTVEQDKNLVLH